jgi:hypothetical protein
MAAAEAVSEAVVTVVIPTRQRARILPAAMESVLSQSYPHLRLLVSDNASEDGTAEVVRAFAARDRRVTLHRHSRDIGATANFQWGLDAVASELFVLLSDDDLLLPGFLRRAVDALSGPGQPAMFCGASVVYDERDGSHAVRPARGWEEGSYGAGAHVARILEHHFLWTGVVFRRTVRDALGPFEPVPMVDVLYLAKAAALFPFVVSLQPCAVFRLTGKNAHLTMTPDDLERTRQAMREAVAALPLAGGAREQALQAVEGNARGVANRALREALAAGNHEAAAALGAWLGERGWLSAGRRMRIAVARSLGLRLGRRRARTPLPLEAVARLYASEESP